MPAAACRRAAGNLRGIVAPGRMLRPLRTAMRMVNCPACGAANSVRRESCYQCGAPLEGNAVASGLPLSTPDARERDALVERGRQEIGDADWQRLRQAQRRTQEQVAAPIYAIMVGFGVAALAVLGFWWWPMTMGPLLDFLSRRIVGEGLSPGPARPWTWPRIAAHAAPSLVLIALIVIASVLFRRCSRVAVEWVEFGGGSAEPQAAHDPEAIAAALNAAAEEDREALRSRRLARRLSPVEVIAVVAVAVSGLAAWALLPDDSGLTSVSALKVAGLVAGLAALAIARFRWWPRQWGGG